MRFLPLPLLLLPTLAFPAPLPPLLLSPPSFPGHLLPPSLPLHPWHPPSSIAPFVGTPAPRKGLLKILVIPIAYSDLPPNSDRTSDPGYLQDLFFGGSRYPYASLRDYYLHESLGTLEITGTVLPWQRTPYTREEIACRRGSLVDCAQACYGLGSPQGTGSTTLGGARFLVGEALQKAVSQGVDLTAYDQDQNGVVDAVIVIHTGRGAEMTSDCRDLWSHQNEDTFTVTIAETPATFKVHYLVGAERFYWPRTQQEFPSGIGVFAHEFGHILGLPDLYNIALPPQSGGGFGVGQYSLMGWGLYRLDGVIPQDNFGPDTLPMALDPWSLERLGWLSPTPITENVCLGKLPAFDVTATVVSFPLNPTGSERILAQYVRNNGFRTPLGRSGLLLWHVDDAMEALSPGGNSSNCIPEQGDCRTLHPWVALLQADGLYDLEKGQNLGDAGDLWKEGQCLTEQSVPSSRRWDRSDSGVRICVLSLLEGITARVNLVVNPGNLPPPPRVLNRPTEKGEVGKPYQFLPRLTDLRGVHFTLVKKPEGMTVHEETGAITWTPQEPGIYPVTLRVENCAGLEDFSFNVEVVLSSAPEKRGCTCSLTDSPPSFPKGTALLLFLCLAAYCRLRNRKKLLF